MNPRKIAKFAANHLVMAVAAKAASKTISNFAPDFADDHELITSLAAGTVGYAISDSLESTTDKMVDAIFNKIQTLKDKKTN